MIKKLKQLIAEQRDGVADDFELGGTVKIKVKDEDGNVKNRQEHEL